MEPTTLTQVAERMVGRGGVRVLDYETPPPRRTARDVAWALFAGCRDSANLVAFLLGLAAMMAGGSIPGSPVAAGGLLAAAAGLWMFATVRWAYGRPGRW